MRIAYLTELPHESLETGGALRRNSLIKALLRAEVDVHTVNLANQRAARPMPLRWRRLANLANLRSVVPWPVDLVHVEGLPLSFAAVAARAMRLPAVIDLVDSWDLARRNALGPARLRSFLGRLSVRYLMTRIVPSALAVTYVSEIDMTWDRHRFRGLPDGFLVPNGTDEELESLTRSPQLPPYHAVFAADWSYEPNRAALHWLAHDVLPHLPENLELIIDLCGSPAPPAGLLAADRRLQYVGWRPRLADLYRTSVYALAPLRSGAGVKNKVLEPIAAGCPVIATSRALYGLPEELTNVPLVADEPEQFARLMVTVLGSDAPSQQRLAAGRRAATECSWAASADRLLDVYRSVLR